jgi:two-component system cell cycle response regulator
MTLPSLHENELSRLKTIVLIDPGTDETATFAKRLEMQGYAVAVTHDPADGARLALADPPASVIADLWMPSISGVQLCRLLKAEPATEHVPVILRGPDSPRNRFWAERAGASAYVVKGRMGDLVRMLREAIAATPTEAAFFTTFAGEDIRERIAAHLDAALFESVLSAELRALGTCGAFDRLFDLLSQFVSRVVTYRWLAVSTHEPQRFGLHANSRMRAGAESEARQALGLDSATIIAVEDDDACNAPQYREPLIRPIELGGFAIGHIALSLPSSELAHDDNFATILAREIAGPIRMVSLVEESQRLAQTDALTGLFNRRAFVSLLQRELSRSTRYGHPLSLVLFDLDHFKKVNDRWGHGVGDTVLQVSARCLQDQGRNTDLAARWGGEEFVMALTSTDAKGAACFCERLRTALERLDIIAPTGERVPVTASIGFAGFVPGESLDAFVDRADKAMYVAKASGRNRVVEAAGPPLISQAPTGRISAA